MKSIKEQIKNRKKQAEEKQISHKADIIAKYLGTGSTNATGSTKETKYYFVNKLFKISSDSFLDEGSDGCAFGYENEISYDNEVVFKIGGSRLYSYIPGKWEIEFEKLFIKAEKECLIQEAKLKKEKIKKERKEKLEIKKRFGLI